MADFFLPPPPQRNWLDPIVKGYEMTGQLQDQATQRNWFNQQTQQAQEERGAIKQFGQTGDTKALMGVNPELAMRIQDHIAKTPPPELMKINMALEAGKALRGSVTPDNYGDYKSLLERNGLPPNYLPPADQVQKNPAVLKDILYAGDIFQAQLKARAESYPVPMYSPSGQNMGMIPHNAKIAPAAGMATPVYDPQTMQQKGVMPPGAIFAPKPETEKHDDASIVRNTLREKLGREPTWGEIDQGVMDRKREVAKAGATGRTEAESAGITPGSRFMNAKAWILGTKPMTSFKGQEKAAISDMAFNAGFDAQDIASIQTNYKALSTGKTRLAGQQALIEAFTNNAKLNMELGTKISDGVNRLGSPSANAWLQWFQGKILGQEVPMTQDVKAFQAIVGPTANEWAKVMTSASGAGGVVSDSARKETWDLLNTTLNKSQFKNVGQVMNEELNNRGKGINMEHQRIDNDLNTLTKYVDDKFGAAFPELVKTSSVQRPSHGSNGGTRILTPQERQAYDTKLGQVQALPDGPQKQQALKQMQDLATKWGIK